MGNKTLLNLNMKSTWSSGYKVFAAIWWIACSITFIIGTFGISGINQKRYDMNFYNISFVSTDIYLFFCGFYHSWIDYDRDGNVTKDYSNFSMGFLLLGIAISVIAFMFPLVIKWFMNFIANRCSLSLEEKQLAGSLRSVFSTKQIQIPIEKIDNVFRKNSIADKLRSGETIVIHSNSGAVKFHYAQNAQEFSNALLKRVDEIKKDYGNAAQSAPQDNTSLSGKMAELQKLKEQGLLSDAEFEEKRKELISKF